MNDLIFIDTETTGLSQYTHEAYEVAWVGEEGEPERLVLPHTWQHGDPFALMVGHYFERRIFQEPVAGEEDIDYLHRELTGATLVGSNPGFDANHLTVTFGKFEYDVPWHYRLVNVAEGAMWLFGWDRPKGLADVTKALREREFEIPEPDHTAVGDVLTTRAVYFALRGYAEVMKERSEL